MIRLTNILLSIAVFAMPAGAHEGHEHEVCLPGELCDRATIMGAWGMIALGALFWLIAMLPNRGAGEFGAGRGFSLLNGLHKRIERESTGWRRLQWPVLGLGFIALGVATLAGWLKIGN